MSNELPFRVLSMPEFEALTTDQRSHYLRRAVENVRLVNDQIKVALEEREKRLQEK